jgi:hypothetical protein
MADVWKLFHDAHFNMLWYAHPGGKWPTKDRWHAGVDTGPQADLICVKNCKTNEEANEWLSPGADTPEEAVKLAVEKRERLAQGRTICPRCGSLGRTLRPVMGWCDLCP